jgi:hypothetical protein
MTDKKRPLITLPAFPTLLTVKHEVNLHTDPPRWVHLSARVGERVLREETSWMTNGPGGQRKSDPILLRQFLQEINEDSSLSLSLRWGM